MIGWILEQHIHTALKPAHGNQILVRQAGDDDVFDMTQIVNEHARQGHLLPRSAESIRNSLDNWLVAELDGRLVGVGSLLEMSPVLAEVRSLAVLPAYRHYGLGRQIVEGLIELARQRGYSTVFALTRAVPFFERLGFTITDKERFPEKVWKDCMVCPLQQRCDETAVVLELYQIGRAGGARRR